MAVQVLEDKVGGKPRHPPSVDRECGNDERSQDYENSERPTAHGQSQITAGAAAIPGSGILVDPVRDPGHSLGLTLTVVIDSTPSGAARGYLHPL